MSNQTPTRIRVVSVLGTRPEAVKLIPIIREIERECLIDSRLVLTGQHGQLVEQILEPLGIKTADRLDVVRANDSLAELLANTILSVDKLYERLAPDMVIVQGDTTSAFAAAVTAFYRRIPIAHVEAGLRSYDRFHPYPEEANRRMISGIADLHLAPTMSAADNLVREGIPRSSIVVTGNTAVDSLLIALRHCESTGDVSFSEKGLTKPLVLITLHRRESWGATRAKETPLHEMLGSLAAVARRRPDVRFVYPVHPNPQVRRPAEALLGGLPNVRLLAPLPYVPFVRLMASCTCIVTDSGGIQEEAPSLGVPVLVLRETTERPEAVQEGMNRVVGMSGTAIQEELDALLDKSHCQPQQVPCQNPYGDGRAAARVVKAVLHFHGLGDAPEEFVNGEPAEPACKLDNGSCVSGEPSHPVR
ncbi:MAG: non-hydrolyzing UDP-N-acetylglucosamine 2-epimerase [Pirellulales bacterium]